MPQDPRPYVRKTIGQLRFPHRPRHVRHSGRSDGRLEDERPRPPEGPLGQPPAPALPTFAPGRAARGPSPQTRPRAERGSQDRRSRGSHRQARRSQWNHFLRSHLPGRPRGKTPGHLPAAAVRGDLGRSVGTRTASIKPASTAPSPRSTARARSEQGDKRRTAVGSSTGVGWSFWECSAGHRLCPARQTKCPTELRGRHDTRKKSVSRIGQLRHVSGPVDPCPAAPLAWLEGRPEMLGLPSRPGARTTLPATPRPAWVWPSPRPGPTSSGQSFNHVRNRSRRSPSTSAPP